MRNKKNILKYKKQVENKNCYDIKKTTGSRGVPDTRSIVIAVAK